MPKAATTVLGTLTALLAGPLAATATPVDLTEGAEIYGGNYSTWHIGDGDADECQPGSPTGVAVVDGEFARLPRVDDAFDGGHQVLVDGTILDDPDNVGTHTDGSVSAGPLLGQVRTTVTHTALQNQPMVRTLVRLKNVTSTAKTRIVSFHSNGGGDAAEDVIATSDGDGDLEPGDNWVVWSPGDADPSGDPTKGTALAGPGTVRSEVNAVSLEPGDPVSPTKDCLAVDYRVRVPGNATRLLLFFTYLDTSTFTTTVNDYNVERRYLFAGLTPRQRSWVLNWSL